ncbi:class I SAM-dependent RNA methyltransferase [Actinoalloteichus fjordicus]|uniref:SAM-dependent methyltransferase, tRNA(Uracil-5)-methyltransferase n=1 Tax=Actinoalloteichus fjordicus TaxID=1612552 RepID=A0AAC9LAF4_9PSEU|nr:class I SAM-dependent RNA methyltransferase [Actinoalloteichus fjordicus]APU13766.1 SAM-dependent methyltransferase, tRNA(uracil-5)-methyltransferase [Actinoalloteichus fjordicus]
MTLSAEPSGASVSSAARPELAARTTATAGVEEPQNPESRPPKVDWTGRRFEVEVGSPGHGGFCVARHEGRVVFVRHALPGEKVVVSVTEDNGGSFCRADAVQIEQASADRVEPPCSVARPGGCGGCDWQHVAPSAQRELKAQVVVEQLRRIAGIELAVVVEELPGGPLGWRSRVRLAVDDRGRPGLRAHRSHRIVPVESCPIAVPGSLDEVLNRRWRARSELEVTSDSLGRLHLAEPGPGSPGRRGAGRQITGGTAVQQAAGREWQIAAHGFWQVHPAAADVFAGVVREWADAPKGGTAWDLYGGAGLFASVLADQVGPTGAVEAVESSRRAVRDGMQALADQPQVRFHAGRVETMLSELAGTAASSESGSAGAGSARRRPDVVVLDPPRKGAGRAVISAVTDARPDRVILVACDPAAMARDIGLFAEAGYRLRQLRAFDAFPMTHHVECIVLLEPGAEQAG